MITTERPFKISDRRYQCPDNSLGTVSFKIAGYDSESDANFQPHPQADPKTHAAFNQYYREYEIQGYFKDEETHKKFNKAISLLQKDTMKKSRVYSTTYYQAADPTFITHFSRPSVICADEALKTTEIEILQVLA